MAQGVGLAGQASVTLSAVLDLPSDSANWTFYASSYDATDDQGGSVGPMELVTSSGTAWLGVSPVTFSHTPGTPFTVSLNVSDFVEESQSFNNFNFELRMFDPVATPEPESFGAAGLGLLLIGCWIGREARRRTSIAAAGL